MKPGWTVRTTDGIRLGGTTAEPTGGAAADLLLLPAMMVDARTLDRPPGRGLASVLVEEGFRVHRADLRGRGMSERPADWTYDDLVYRDIPALVEHVRGMTGRIPWVVGHSLGGHAAVASWAVGAVRLAGWVGLGANVWTRDGEPSRRRRWVKRCGLGLLRLGVAATGKIPARALRLGPVDEAGSYGRDLVRFWRGWRSRCGVDWQRALGSIRGPALAVVSDGDRLLAHPDGAEAWARHIPGVAVHRVRGPTAPDHMGLVVDLGAAPIWRFVAAWIRERTRG